jgi:cell division septum initiation protein DivIVA
VSPKERPLRRSSLEASTSERLAAIVAAAEQAASKVIDDAEAEGNRYLSEAQAEADRIVAERLSSVAALTDSLVAQAEMIRQQAERLLESLAQARAELGPESDLGPAPRGSHLSAVAPVEEPEPAEAAQSPPSGRQGNAGARLLATQMAVSGSSREEIESRLRNGFEIEDTGAILDAILGPED